MQFLSMAAIAAAGPESPGDAARRLAEMLSSRAPAIDPTTMALVLAGSIVIQVVAYWIAAKVVVGNESGTLKRAFFLWLFSLLAAIGMGVVLVVGLFLANASQQPLALPIAAGGWLLLSSLIALLLPAKVFATDLVRSFGILVLSGLIVLAAQAGIDRALGRPVLERWAPLRKIASESSERRARRFKHLFDGSPVAQIDNELDRLSSAAERNKTFTERQEALRPIPARLEELRKGLKPDDRDGLAEYEALHKRYEAAMRRLRADYAASQQRAPATP